MKRLFSSKKKYSRDNAVFLCDEVARLEPLKSEDLVEVLRELVEVVVWGDKHEESIFELFLERNLLLTFATLFADEESPVVTRVQVVQCVTILFQNLSKQESVYFLLSNDRLNRMIGTEFDTRDDELVSNFVSFLKTLSLRLDKHSIHFFFSRSSFPLYTTAAKLLTHEDRMVRTSARSIIMNVLQVDSSPDIVEFLAQNTPKVFSSLFGFIKGLLVSVDEALQAVGEPDVEEKLASALLASSTASHRSTGKKEEDAQDGEEEERSMESEEEETDDENGKKMKRMKKPVRRSAEDLTAKADEEESHEMSTVASVPTSVMDSVYAEIAAAEEEKKRQQQQGCGDSADSAAAKRDHDGEQLQSSVPSSPPLDPISPSSSTTPSPMVQLPASSMPGFPSEGSLLATPSHGQLPPEGEAQQPDGKPLDSEKETANNEQETARESMSTKAVTANAGKKKKAMPSSLIAIDTMLEDIVDDLYYVNDLCGVPHHDTIVATLLSMLHRFAEGWLLTPTEAEVSQVLQQRVRPIFKHRIPVPETPPASPWHPLWCSPHTADAPTGRSPAFFAPAKVPHKLDEEEGKVDEDDSPTQPISTALRLAVLANWIRINSIPSVHRHILSRLLLLPLDEEAPVVEGGPDEELRKRRAFYYSWSDPEGTRVQPPVSSVLLSALEGDNVQLYPMALNILVAITKSKITLPQERALVHMDDKQKLSHLVSLAQKLLPEGDDDDAGTAHLAAGTTEDILAAEVAEHQADGQRSIDEEQQTQNELDQLMAREDGSTVTAEPLLFHLKPTGNRITDATLKCLYTQLLLDARWLRLNVLCLSLFVATSLPFGRASEEQNAETDYCQNYCEALRQIFHLLQRRWRHKARESRRFYLAALAQRSSGNKRAASVVDENKTTSNEAPVPVRCAEEESEEDVFIELKNFVARATSGSGGGGGGTRAASVESAALPVGSPLLGGGAASTTEGGSFEMLSSDEVLFTLLEATLPKATALSKATSTVEKTGREVGYLAPLMPPPYTLTPKRVASFVGGPNKEDGEAEEENRTANDIAGELLRCSLHQPVVDAAVTASGTASSIYQTHWKRFFGRLPLASRLPATPEEKEHVELMSFLLARNKLRPFLHLKRLADLDRESVTSLATTLPDDLLGTDSNAVLGKLISKHRQGATILPNQDLLGAASSQLFDGQRNENSVTGYAPTVVEGARVEYSPLPNDILPTPMIGTVMYLYLEGPQLLLLQPDKSVSGKGTVLFAMPLFHTEAIVHARQVFRLNLCQYKTVTNPTGDPYELKVGIALRDRKACQTVAKAIHEQRRVIRQQAVRLVRRLLQE